MDTARYRVERPAWPDELPAEPTFPLDGAPIHEHLRARAAADGDAPALTFYGRTLSWTELDRLATRFGAALADRGHDPGDVCALYLQNCPQFWIAYHGAHRAGLVVAPLNPQLRDVVLAYMLEENGTSAIVTHPDQLSTLEAVDEAIRPDDVFVVQYRTYAGTAAAPIPVHDVVTEEPAVPDGYPRFEAVVNDADATRTLPEPAADDRALLQHTGGTTGMPKACVHTHWNVTFKAVARSQVPTPDVIQLAVMPVFHVAGKLGAVDGPTVSGQQVVVLPRYTPEQMLAAIEAYGATTTWLTVPMVEELLDHPDRDAYDLTSLSANRDVMRCTSFGKTLTAELSERWAEVTGARLAESGYGLSETHTGDVHTAGLERIDQGFVGQPTYGVTVEIRDVETDEVLPAGDEGEIVLYTPSTMDGYLDRPEATAAVMDDDGALHTGDIGRLTPEGFLYFLGRRKDALKVSGHTLSPREVEYALEESGLVHEALVVGRPHERRGHVPEAHVVPAAGVDEPDILAWAADHLAEFKRPTAVVLCEAFPRTDLGKVDRKAYRETLPDDYH